MDENIIQPTLTVESLIDEGSSMNLKLIAGKEGLGNKIDGARIQKLGLGLAGHIEFIHPGRVQILGGTEINFINKLSTRERSDVLDRITSRKLCCLIVTKGLTIPSDVVEKIDKAAVPLLQTDMVSSDFINVISRFLEERLAPRLSIHAVFIDVYGLGVLIQGDSGVGKSECALDLVVRGHRLVSDDIVEIKKVEGRLVGSSPEMFRYHMELRGLGIINIKDLFGVAAVRYKKEIEMVIELSRWEEGKEYDRLGVQNRTYKLMDVDIPYLIMPVAPGRNLAILVEVASRNHLLRLKGYRPTRVLNRPNVQGFSPAPEEAPRKDEKDGLS